MNTHALSTPARAARIALSFFALAMSSALVACSGAETPTDLAAADLAATDLAAADRAPEGAPAVAAELGSGALDPLGIHGGTGGDVQWLRCPTYVGITGRTGNYVDLFEPRCEDVNTRWGWPSVGRGGGENPFNAPCPEGFIVTGIQGRAHTYVDALGVICSRTSNWYDKAASDVYGGGGGDFFWDECPEGQKVVGFNTRGKNWLDRIEPVCGPM